MRLNLKTHTDLYAQDIKAKVSEDDVKEIVKKEVDLPVFLYSESRGKHRSLDTVYLINHYYKGGAGKGICLEEYRHGRYLFDDIQNKKMLKMLHDNNVLASELAGIARGMFIDSASKIDYVLGVIICNYFGAYTNDEGKRAAKELVLDRRGRYYPTGSRLELAKKRGLVSAETYPLLTQILEVRNDLAHSFLPDVRVTDEGGIVVDSRNELYDIGLLLNNAWYELLKDFILIQDGVINYLLAVDG